jgi:hypothetical protein
MSRSKKQVTQERPRPTPPPAQARNSIRAQAHPKPRRPRRKPAARDPIVEGPPLQPAEARAVLQKHLTNIVRKAAAGKTLSQREQQEIGRFAEIESDAAAANPHAEWVSSYEQLGLIVGLHRASFPRIRRDKPDAPKPRANGDHSVSAWRAFLTAHPEIQCRSEASAPAKSELELEKLRQQCRRIKSENDRSDNLYLWKADVDGWLVETIEAIKAKLRAKLLNELPPKLEGLRAAEMAAKLEPLIAQICDLLRFVHES